MIGAYLLFKERVNRLGIVSILIAIAGMLLIGWETSAGGDDDNPGDILSVLGTLAVSVHMLAS